MAGFTALQASEVISAFDWITSAVVFLYLIYIRHYLLKIAREVHLETASASSYTVELSQGLPEDITEQELIDHFNRLYALNAIDHRGRPQMEPHNIASERQKFQRAKDKKDKKVSGLI